MSDKKPLYVDGLEKFLSDSFCKGVGKKTAKKIVDKFGENTISVLENRADELVQVDGLSNKKTLLIEDNWSEKKDFAKKIIPLLSLGFTKAFALKVQKQLGIDAFQIISKNPYILASNIHGVGFLKADVIAMNLNFDKESNFRIKAGIQYFFLSQLESGLAYFKKDDFFKQLFLLLGFDLNNKNIQTSCENIFEELKKKNEFIELIDGNKDLFVSLKKAAISEKTISEKVIGLLAKTSPNLKFNLTTTFLEINQKFNMKNDIEKINLSLEQIEAVCSSLVEKITIITGGPGTGKTTLLKELIKVLKEKNKSFLLTAPTGKAAKRLSQSTGESSKTLHRALEINPFRRCFSKNETNPLLEEFIIIDEFSMVDMFLGASLFQAINLEKSHLVILGDVNQLPSVGAGKVLQDLIDSKKIKTIVLTHIFRQSEGSLIVENAHKINSGLFPSNFTSGCKKDFIFKKVDFALDFKEELINFFSTKSPLKLDIKKTIILTPMHKGEGGSIKINNFLQDFHNKTEEKKIMYFDKEFRVGDPIIVQKNNYSKMVFNGDSGLIIEAYLDKKTPVLVAKIEDLLVEFKGAEISTISLAYAISIHKSQGSEFDFVIIPVFTEHYMMLCRKVIYTAVTRAKKGCILIGQVKALAIAVKNNKDFGRKTFLQHFLSRA